MSTTFDPDNPVGVWDDLDEATYRAHPALSASDAKVLLGQHPPSPTSGALEFGTLVHTAVLEPETLDRFAVLTPPNGSFWAKGDGTEATNATMTGEYRSAMKAALADGLTPVADDDWRAAEAMTTAVRDHPAAANVLAACPRREVSVFAEIDGVLCKGRFDLLGDTMLADLKTCRDAEPSRYGRVIENHMIHVSLANYLALAEAVGLGALETRLVLAEKHTNRVVVVDPTRYLDVGNSLMVEARRRHANGQVGLPEYVDEVAL